MCNKRGPTVSFVNIDVQHKNTIPISVWNYHQCYSLGKLDIKELISINGL